MSQEQQQQQQQQRGDLAPEECECAEILRALGDDNKRDPIGDLAVEIVTELYGDVHDREIPWHDIQLHETVETILRRYHAVQLQTMKPPMLIAQYFSRYARHDNDCPLYGYPILPGDTRCGCGLSEAATIVEQNEQANHCDRDALQAINEQLQAALPDFKGCPAPTDWAQAAIRELSRRANAASEISRHFHYGPHNTPDQNRALASLVAALERTP